MDPNYTGVGYTGLVWRRERLGHLSQQSKAPTPESVGSKETSLPVMSEVDCTPILLEDHMTTDIAQGWVANSPSPMPSDAAESATVVPTVSACAAMIPLLLSKLLGIRYSSLEDGVVAVSRMIGLSLLIWILFSKQVLSTHVPAPLKTAKKEFLPLCSPPLITRVRVSCCLSVHFIDIVYLLTMHAAGYMHSFIFNAVLFVSYL